MAVRRLKRDNLIRVAARTGRISLTDAGKAIAEELLERHHLIERMLVEIFGMEWYKVHDEAEQLEHAVSADFERILREKLGAEGACPHGAVGAIETPEDRRRRGLIPLVELGLHLKASVEFIFERDRQLLEYLDSLGIRPGSTVEILAKNYDDTLILKIEDAQTPLGKSASEKIWVSQAAMTEEKYSIDLRSPSSSETRGSHPKI